MLGYLRHLANFARIVEAGSVTGAANRAQVSPSQMSESLKVAEAYFGAPLVERHSQGVRPTSLGTVVYEDAAKMLASAERALATEAVDRGPIRVSVPEELAAGALAPAWIQLQSRPSTPHLQIYCEDAHIDIERFARDLLVRVTHSDPPAGLVVLETVEMDAVMVGVPELARSPESACLLTAPRRQSDVTVGEDTARPLRFQRTLQVSAIQARLALARQGLGLIRCLSVSVADDIASGRLTEVDPIFRISGVRAFIGTPHARPSEALRDVANTIAQALIT